MRNTRDARTDRPVSADAGTAALSPPVRWALGSLALSTLMPSLNTSIANAALPTLAHAFDASFQEAQWIVLAYLLAITCLIVGVGQLGDVIGRRRLLLIGIGLFTAASALCGVAPGLALLIAARTVQGLGAAIMMALTVAIVGETVPKGRTGSAMGLLGALSAIGTTLGPALGGALIAGFGWRAIFLVNVPLGIVSLVLVRRHLPVDGGRARVDRIRPDTVGTTLLVLTLLAYALAMTIGRGGLGPVNLALLVAAAMGTGLFVRAETRATSPMIDPKKFLAPALSASLAMSALVAAVLMATLVVGPFYLAHALDLRPARVGLALSIGPLVAALAGWPAGRLVDRIGAEWVTIVGLVGVASGAVVLATMPLRFGLLGYLAPIGVMTASYALFQTANNTAVMKDVGPGERGVISGMLSLSRNLGLITGAAVLGAVFAHATATIDITTAGPAAVAGGMRMTFLVAAAAIVVALALALWTYRRTVRGQLGDRACGRGPLDASSSAPGRGMRNPCETRTGPPLEQASGSVTGGASPRHRRQPATRRALGGWAATVFRSLQRSDRVG